LQLNNQGKTVIMVTHDVEFVTDCKPHIVLMAQGRIIAEGEANKVLTDPEVVSQASLILPEVTQIFLGLRELDLPQDVIDVYEASRILLTKLGES